MSKTGNNTALPNIYPQINLQATHSKKKFLFQFLIAPPPPKKKNHLQVATRQARIKVFILSNIQVLKNDKHKHEGNWRGEKMTQGVPYKFKNKLDKNQ